MVSSLNDFFAALHREVTLPDSGLVVAVRKPDLWLFVGAGELPIPSGPRPPEGTTDALRPGISARDADAYTERAIAGGVISPPMSCARDHQGDPIYSDHYVHVSELKPADKLFLGNVMLELLGLTTEVATDLAAFRPDPERQDDPSLSGTLSSLAQ